MANISLESIEFPDIDNIYTVFQLDSSLTFDGYAAESSAVGAAMDTKADKDGNYPDLTAGLADMATQLKSTVGITDEEPYLFRTSGGSADIGDFETDKIIGGSVAWNQLVQNGNFFDNSAWSAAGGVLSVNNNTGTITYNGTSTYYVTQSISTQKGHKYYMSATLKANEEHSYSSHIIFGWGDSQAKNIGVIPTTKTKYDAIYSPNADGVSFTFYASTTNATTGDSIDMNDIMLFDLTQMFGTAIADYIYSLEQATEGAGVAWFRKLFSKSYYQYNPGTLIHVGNISKHRMVGFNAYDHTTGKAKVVGGNAYQITGTYSALSLDGETITPDSGGYFTPAESGEITVTGGNATDTCIHLVWDGERDGEYAPYVAYEYPLDADFWMMGIPKLDANNKLYFDGDEYASDGTVTQRYGMVDLGSLNWNRTQSGLFNTESLRDLIKRPSSSTIVATWVISSMYTAMNSNDITGPNGTNPSPNGVMAVNPQGAMFFNNTSYTDAATFKTAMSGIYLVYELAEPTYAQVDPFENPQRVDDFGTEEYVAEPFGTNDVIVPVGHNTFYQANLRAKLEMSPNSPDGDGDYIVRQANGENTYVPLVLTPGVQVAEKFIEFSPAVSVAAGGVYSTYNDNIVPESITGYTPKMVTVQGTNSLTLIPLGAYISSDNSRIMVDLRNVADQAVSLTSLTVDILYIKS